MTVKQEFELELREEARHEELMFHDSDYFLEHTNFTHIQKEWEKFEIMCIKYKHSYKWYKENEL
jgi:hypothetical protein